MAVFAENPNTKQVVFERLIYVTKYCLLLRLAAESYTPRRFGITFSERPFSLLQI